MEFVDKAVSLAHDKGQLQELRSKITARRAKLFHDLVPVHALEVCLGEAVAASLPPDHIQI